MDFITIVLDNVENKCTGNFAAVTLSFRTNVSCANIHVDTRVDSYGFGMVSCVAFSAMCVRLILYISFRRIMSKKWDLAGNDCSNTNFFVCIGVVARSESLRFITVVET